MKIHTRTVSTIKGLVTIYTLTNTKGASVELSSLGAGTLSVIVPDKNGNLVDVALGYKNISDYLYDGPCMGKTPGRYANRIASGKFSLDGQYYQLPINNGPNSLHGGPEGFQNQIWESHIRSANTIQFTYQSKDGEMGYPGNLDAEVCYTWDDECKLAIEYAASADRKTIINLTNHTYFNLNGHGSGTVLDHLLEVPLKHYLPTDSTLIPTGEFAEVNGTPMDFTTAKPIGQNIKEDFPALNYGKGYDNSWVETCFDSQIRHMASLKGSRTGITLNVLSNQPAVQIYTGNWLEGCPMSKSEHSYSDYDGVALECQGLPDSPNKLDFPSQTLAPGDKYKKTIQFVFSAE
ncbi:MAG: galactose mutarotase [Bacteroidales bacterium]|nr:galactose mutarotase [Bacteroidales bacterium]